MNDTHYMHVDTKEGFFEELSLQTKKLVPSRVEGPSPELKSLSKNIKYVFLGPKKTFLMVI